MTRPLCRYCGKAISKRTKTVIFGQAPGRQGQLDYWSYREERPKTKEEVQRLLNQEVMSVRYGTDHALPVDQRERFVTQATTWDGETYSDKFFCNGDHARQFGYAAAEMKERFFATEAYFKALNKKKDQNS